MLTNRVHILSSPLGTRKLNNLLWILNEGFNHIRVLDSSCQKTMPKEIFSCFLSRNKWNKNVISSNYKKADNIIVFICCWVWDQWIISVSLSLKCISKVPLNCMGVLFSILPKVSLEKKSVWSFLGLDPQGALSFNENMFCSSIHYLTECLFITFCMSYDNVFQQ